MLRSAMMILACLWLAAASVPADSGSGIEVSARPGSVVRWHGDGIESCGRDGASWAPLANGCWFPIDLLRPEGPMAVYRVRAGVREQAAVMVTEYPYPVQRIEIDDTSKVDLSAEDLARVKRDQARVRPLWSLTGIGRFDLPLGRPLQELGAAGSFGSRRFFNDQPRSPHSGADYPAVEGTPVFSVAPGRVALADDLFFSGRSVFIDHGDGLVSMYFHLSSVLVEEDQEVEGGSPIGEVGKTGRTTGPHLHFGVRWKGARVDPSLLLGPANAIPELAETSTP